MSDSELLRLLRQIDGHNDKIRQIIERIELSSRSDSNDISKALHTQCWQPALAEHVGGHFLGPSWVNEDGIYRKH